MSALASVSPLSGDVPSPARGERSERTGPLGAAGPVDLHRAFGRTPAAGTGLVPHCPRCGPAAATELVAVSTRVDDDGVAIARVFHAGGCRSVFEYRLTAANPVGRAAVSRSSGSVGPVALPASAGSDLDAPAAVASAGAPPITATPEQAVDTTSPNEPVEVAEQVEVEVEVEVVEVEVAEAVEAVDVEVVDVEAVDVEVAEPVEVVDIEVAEPVDGEAQADVETGLEETAAEANDVEPDAVEAELDLRAEPRPVPSLFTPSGRRTGTPPVEVTPVRAIASLTPAPDPSLGGARSAYRPAVGLRTPLAFRRQGGFDPSGTSAAAAESAAVATTPPPPTAPTFSFNRTVDPSVVPAGDSAEARIGRGRAPIVVRGRTAAPVVVGAGPITATGTAVGHSAASASDEEGPEPAGTAAMEPNTRPAPEGAGAFAAGGFAADARPAPAGEPGNEIDHEDEDGAA